MLEVVDVGRQAIDSYCGAPATRPSTYFSSRLDGCAASGSSV
jgi:hypothetical protein